MKLSEYIRGRRIVLYSPHRPDEVAKRINAAAGSRLNPFNHGVSGGVYRSHLRLVWDIPWFSNGFRPVLSGSLSQAGRSTCLSASYGAPFFMLAFLAFWYGFLAIFSVMLVSIVLGDQPKTGDEWILFLVVPVFCLLPIGFHLVANCKADEHCDAILEWLAREADFQKERSIKKRL